MTHLPFVNPNVDLELIARSMNLPEGRVVEGEAFDYFVVEYPEDDARGAGERDWVRTVEPLAQVGVQAVLVSSDYFEEEYFSPDLVPDDLTPVPPPTFETDPASTSYVTSPLATWGAPSVLALLPFDTRWRVFGTTGGHRPEEIAGIVEYLDCAVADVTYKHVRLLPRRRMRDLGPFRDYCARLGFDTWCLDESTPDHLILGV